MGSYARTTERKIVMTKKICDRCGSTISDTEQFSAHFTVDKVRIGITNKEFDKFEKETDLCAKCYAQWLEFRNSSKIVSCKSVEVRYLEDRLRRCCHALNEIERALKGSGEFDSWIERRHKKNKDFMSDIF